MTENKVPVPRAAGHGVNQVGAFHPAYLQVEKNRYREDRGLAFEDFVVGQKFKHRPGLTITQQDNEEEALDTINAAQLHYDANYASKTEWVKNLGVSTLTLQRVIGMASKTYLRRHSILGFLDIAMTHPVFGGDTLYTESEILAKAEYPENPEVGLLTVRLDGVKQDGSVVTKIKAQFLIYKRGKGAEGIPPSESAPLTEPRFSAYRTLPDGSLIEEIGLFYEDFKVGEIYEHRPGKTILATESIQHSLRSLDLTPHYSDLTYSQRSGSDRFRISETFLVGLVTALSTRTLGKVVANLGWTDIKFLKNMNDGEMFYAESEITFGRLSKSRPTQGILSVASRGLNAHGEVILSYNRTLLVYRKGCGPYEAAGY
jgi:itaconyl-CoA hydratase